VVVSLGFGGLLALTGSPWWWAALVGLSALAFFLWAPHSRRYSVHPELGVTALRRDERTQAINDKAARNGFIVTALAIAAIAVYYGTYVQGDVPIPAIHLALVLAVCTYFVSDVWLRRS
jgi:hypothetical protein